MANNLKLEYLIGHSDLSGQMGGQSGAAVTHPQGNVQDVGSNPAATRNGNRRLQILAVTDFISFHNFVDFTLQG